MTGSRRTPLLAALAAVVIVLAGAWWYFDPSLADSGADDDVSPGGALVDPRTPAANCQEGELRLCNDPFELHAALGPSSRVLVTWLADFTGPSRTHLYARQLTQTGTVAGPVLDLGVQDPLKLGMHRPSVAGVTDGWIVATPANAVASVAGVHVTDANTLTARRGVRVQPADSHVRALDQFCAPAVEISTPRATFRVGSDPKMRLRVNPTPCRS